MKDKKNYILAFTSGEKAERYNYTVLRNSPGVIREIKKNQSKEFTRRLVSAGVEWMLLDFPPENDWEFFGDDIPLEKKRDYAIVHLKGLVTKWA